jgi:CSLREA domain-containing protein
MSKRPTSSRLAVATLIATLIAPVGPAALPATAIAATSQFVSRNGQELVLNGQTFRFSGVNMFNANSDGYCGQAYTDQQLADAFTEIGQSDDVVVRAWFYQPLAASKAPGTTREWTGTRDWARFDRMLQIASTQNVKVIPVLTDHGGECGDFGTTGVKTAEFYQTGYTVANPDELARYEHWVSYRDWAQEVVERYRDDPTVLFWQLINEAEVNPNYPGPWAQDMSDLVRSIDANHLISLGTIGTGQCGAGSSDEYQRIHDLPNIDLCEYHDYDQTADMPGDEFNGLTSRIDRCRALNKPLFVGEVGINPANVGGTFEARAAKFRSKILRQEAEGIVGHLAWAYMRSGSTIDNFDIGPGDPALTVLREAPAFVVNATNDVDDGTCDATHCSLREAILAVNGNPGLDTVAFNFRQTSEPPPKISLQSPLASVDQPTVVDGTTEPFYGIVQLDGSSIRNADGLVVAGGGSRIQGLAIGGFGGFERAAIVLGGSGHSRVVGNAIGLDATLSGITPNRLGVFVLSPENVIGASSTPNVIAGNTDHGIKVGRAETPTLDTHGNVIQSNIIGYSPGAHGDQINPAPNAFDGIELNSTTGTLIGGTAWDEGNTISGNGRVGVSVTSPANTIEGNRIGTDTTGTVAVPNRIGISVSLAADNVIGGSDPGAGNVLSGNTDYGIQIDGPDTRDTHVYGNVIGTDLVGMTAVPNGIAGVLLTGTGSLVGNGDPSARNVISGNGYAGIWFGANSIGNSVETNLIGVAADGTTPLANGNGIISNDSNNQGNRVGANGSGGNTIAHNAGLGIGVRPSTTTMVIAGNRIFSNGGLGIDLGMDGSTPNDVDDADNGPNHLQNSPVIRAESSATATTIRGSVDGAPGTTDFVIDFFDNGTCDPSGFGEGETFLGEIQVAATAAGDASFTFDPATVVPGTVLPVGHFVTATAAKHVPSISNETSEFSACAEVTPPTDTVPPVVTGSPDRAPNASGWYAAPVTVTWTSTDPAPSSGTPSTVPPTNASTEGASVRYVSPQSCDPAGNCATGEIRLSIDTIKPVVTAPVPTVLVGTPMGATSASVSLDWSGSGDATSGVARYDVLMENNGACCTTVASSTATSAAVSGLVIGRSYRFKIVATDHAGNVQTGAFGPTIKVTAVDDQPKNGPVAYAPNGAWTASKVNSAYSGTLTSTSTVGATATLAFQGQQVAFVAQTTATAGNVRISIDGVLAASLSLRSPAPGVPRQVVFVKTFTVSGKHSIRIEAAGGGPINLDAFLIVK